MPEIDVSMSAPKRTLYQRLIVASVKPVRWIMEQWFIPWLSYTARVSGIFKSPTLDPDTNPVAYIQASGPVNSFLLMAAFDEQIRDRTEDPDGRSAILNAILESIHQCERIQDASVTMFGSLVAAGCPPEQAFMQYLANGIDLGMYVERRLQSANAGEPLNRTDT